jgi:PAS domain-containing protein
MSERLVSGRASGISSIFTIPSSDRAFAEHVRAVRARHPSATTADFERRLRTVFPRVVVRERSLSGENASWYVYRDGSWRPQASGPWWLEESSPRVTVSADGWIVDVSRTAADLLGISTSDTPPHHITDFIFPGDVEDALALFEVVKRVAEFDATVLLRPISGEVIAVDLHMAQEKDQLAAVFRLAEDVDVPAEAGRASERPDVTFKPATDVAFRAYAERALERMAEPKGSGLELRLRRLYPHATVTVDGNAWTVVRDRDAGSGQGTRWWLDALIPRVRYDAQALILEANEAATQMFGRQLVGHYWQEFVTPGSTEQVTVMLGILAEAGAAESRFRMPRPDGSLLEFDSYTEVVGDEFTTAFRPVAG